MKLPRCSFFRLVVFSTSVFIFSGANNTSAGIQTLPGQEPIAKGQQPTEPPRVFIMDGVALAALKERIKAEPTSFTPQLERLRKEAAAYLDV